MIQDNFQKSIFSLLLVEKQRFSQIGLFRALFQDEYHR